MRLVSEGAKFAAKARRCLGQIQQRRGFGGHLSQAKAAVTLPANYGFKGIGGGIIYRKKNRHFPQQRPMLAGLRERFATG
ncbi:hypothetical protein KFZ76_08150 [Methylovulum psychrotolerans]|uniref:hypothetical protein n=1 Tax=Methylovulum psychrotolerans TaxID=1704499 RepID=UPI001BFF861A|nr:hypothetical protein [Methylovulum psychrotolerans]MBT9097677.1 hypothetical protein [Methylovulum psychrotolerans]